MSDEARMIQAMKDSGAFREHREEPVGEMQERVRLVLECWRKAEVNRMIQGPAALNRDQADDTVPSVESIITLISEGQGEAVDMERQVDQILASVHKWLEQSPDRNLGHQESRSEALAWLRSYLRQNFDVLWDGRPPSPVGWVDGGNVFPTITWDTKQLPLPFGAKLYLSAPPVSKEREALEFAHWIFDEIAAEGGEPETHEILDKLEALGLVEARSHTEGAGVSVSLFWSATQPLEAQDDQ